MELGVTYIPWEKLKETEILALREGAVLDQETLKPGTVSLSRAHQTRTTLSSR